MSETNRLEAIRARLDAAFPPPFGVMRAPEWGERDSLEAAPEVAEFWATSGADIRWLLAEVDQHEREMAEVIGERDAREDMCDRLAASIAPRDVLGEHSSWNDPWRNALDYAEANDLTGERPVRRRVSAEQFEAAAVAAARVTWDTVHGSDGPDDPWTIPTWDGLNDGQRADLTRNVRPVVAAAFEALGLDVEEGR